EGDSLPVRGQASPVIRLVLHNTLVREALEHPRGGGRRHAESLRDCRSPDRARVAALQLIERLRVVLGALVGAALRVGVVCRRGYRGIEAEANSEVRRN